MPSRICDACDEMFTPHPSMIGNDIALCPECMTLTEEEVTMERRIKPAELRVAERCARAVRDQHEYRSAPANQRPPKPTTAAEIVDAALADEARRCTVLTVGCDLAILRGWVPAPRYEHCR